MKKLERYVKEITKDLPEDEKEELTEEIYGHLQDHVNELLIKGQSEKKAIRYDIRNPMQYFLTCLRYV
ncbi:hypothetical protein FIU87_16210 [Bacillus sp. THAF10]|uniref:hypothetical protein n=1 Tax=Bacillus sp. THAF10 TaxID=2587848 RepID=UPI001267E563|nr:hypothetical protein [Bacillus sp. THAF10]QFT90208.1 hypothetical protein FIU87_16210 [Bacillus sp. THAF10]